MAEEQDKKDEAKFEFTAEGEALGYISLDQARLRAIQHAREHTDVYGPRYSQVELVWEVLDSEEGEDYYQVRLSYRPAQSFRGRPGLEQFTIDKTGPIELRQILSQPRPSRSFGIALALVGIILASGAAAGVLFATGVFTSDQTPGAGQAPAALGAAVSVQVLPGQPVQRLPRATSP